jgi:hypothetical protein
MPQVGFYALDKAKQEQFLERLRLRGIDPKRVIGLHLDTKAVGGTLRIHADLASSHLVSHERTVYSIADLKRVDGVPDSEVEARPQDLTDYPDEPKFDVPKLVARYRDPRALGMLLGPEGKATVKKATAAYLSGNSKRVAALGYEPIINALHFPLVTVAAAADTITVQNGQTATFGQPGQQPQGLSVTAITIYGAGELKFECDFTLDCTGPLAQQSG